MAKEKTLSPMMQHYVSIKEKYPDTLLFYRVGDFYEMFMDDAVIASKELDLVLTGKNAGLDEKVPMCGVPHHAVKTYLTRLAARGFKVAIVEQVQDPKEATGLVERDVIRVITPGTVMDEITDEKQSVYLAAVEDYKYGYAVAFCEVSTGENFIETCSHKDNALLQLILKNNGREVVVRKGFNERIIRRFREMQVVISYCEEDAIHPVYEPLITNLDKDYEKTCFGMLLNYLEATQKHALSHLQVCHVEQESQVLYMDYSTQANLELTVPMHDTGRQITLWSFLDCCKSAMGSRLLRKWIEKPLISQKRIEERLDRVAWLMRSFMVRNTVREALSNVYDLQRLIARCALNTANAVYVQRLTKTLEQVPIIQKKLDSSLFGEIVDMDALQGLYTQLKNAFLDEPSLSVNEGGMFRDGYDAQLDEVRSIQRNGKEFIASLEASEREKTGFRTLKVGYNRVYGYYIEISKLQAKDVKEEWGYVRKQTLTNNERFISPELKEKEDMILHANERAIAIEKQLFSQLMDNIRSSLPKLQKIAEGLALADVYCALAEDSAKYGYVRPVFTDGLVDIRSGRHPILDEIMKDPKYVSNNLYLDDQENILLITGPNMGGKSTYMRQIALIVIMAQIGCYVPASSCQIPVFDKIFTRIGASDDILSGQSTFMVEMNEANRALQQATDHSLILFDEIGRGTSTYDGMSLAQAMIEYIASVIHAKTLFSTHYHELTSLAESVGCVRNVHAAVKEEDNQVTFLYKIKKGPAQQSYGINVARLAGLPGSVLERAADIQKELESKKRVVQQSFQLVEMKKEDPVADGIMEQLKAVSIDDLSPREAWNMLNDMCEEVKKHG